MNVTQKLDFGNGDKNNSSRQSNRNTQMSHIKQRANSNKQSVKQYAKFKPKVVSNAQDKITSSNTYKAIEEYSANRYQNKINEKVDSIESIENRSDEYLLIVLQTIGKLNIMFSGTILNHELSMIHNIKSIKILSNTVIITQDTGTLNCTISSNIHSIKKDSLVLATIKYYSTIFENNLKDIFINSNTIKSIQQANIYLSKNIGISFEDGDIDLGKFTKDIGLTNLQSNLAEGYINIMHNGCNITDNKVCEIIINFNQFDSYQTFITFIKFIMNYRNYLTSPEIDDLEIKIKINDDINFVNLTENSPEAKLKFFVQTQISMDSSMLPIKVYLDRNSKSPSLSFSNENANVEILDINDRVCKYNVWLEGYNKKHEKLISSAILNDSYEDIKYNIKFKYMYILAEVLPKILPIDESVISCLMGINVPINKPIAINFTLNPSFINLVRKLKKMRINIEGTTTRFLIINKTNVEWVKDKPKQAIIVPAINFSRCDTLVMFIQYLMTKGNHLYLSNEYIDKERELITKKNRRKEHRL